MKKFTTKQIKVLKTIWKEAKKARDKYWANIAMLESQAQVATGIECEIFHCDNALAGIGDVLREYKLLQQEELE